MNASPTATQRRLNADDVALFPASWRLLGSNHRELGRSAELFRSVEACIESIRELRTAIPDVESDVVAHRTAGYWYWRLSIGAVPVAVSSRLYQRRRESAQSLLRTLENIQLVDREPEILRSRPMASHGTTRAPIMPRRSKVIDLRDQVIDLTQNPRTGALANDSLRPTC